MGSGAHLSEAIILPPSSREGRGAHPGKLHPELARRLLSDYAKPNTSILDPFVGSGTTLAAATSAGHSCRGYDIEPTFVDAASKHGDARVGDARSLPEAAGSWGMILTSPPYGPAIGRACDRAPEKTARAKADYEIKRFGRVVSRHAEYGRTDGNMGAVSVADFWSMYESALREMHRVLVPEGLAVIVVRDFRLGRSRLGAVDLFGETVRRAAGFTYVGRRTAVLSDADVSLWQRVNAERWGIPIPNVEHVAVLRKSSKVTL